VLFISSGDSLYAQVQSFDEFMEWCEPQFGDKCAEIFEESGFATSETNYNFVIISISIVIAFAVLANYLWSKRKGREFSEE